MNWNWELPSWPNFHYDREKLWALERRFLLRAERTSVLQAVDINEFKNLIVNSLTEEGINSAKIEGEFLERDAFEAIIKGRLDLQEIGKEIDMAQMIWDVYENWQKPLTHEMLWHWHQLLFKNKPNIQVGCYRTFSEPMQIVSSNLNQVQILFEAPPSARVLEEMGRYIDWFNKIDPNEPLLGKVAIAHIYFESIHPFEDGNGRIGRALTEKMLSQGIGRPILIATSKVLEQRKKEYYAELGRCNRSLDANDWVQFFASCIVQAQDASVQLIDFLLQKSKMLQRLEGQLNERQLKALLRMFDVGANGLHKGLSAEKYIGLTKATRATATRDLADLVEKGALVKKGKLRHTRYELNMTFTTY